MHGCISQFFFNHDGSKVTVPPAFLSRNQLASTGSEAAKQVVKQEPSGSKGY